MSAEEAEMISSRETALRLVVVYSEDELRSSGGVGVGGAGDNGQGVAKTISIRPANLSAKSPFFCKLFSNGMKESYESHATLVIGDSEENAVMELLGFMENGKLTTTEPSLLVSILLAADKYDVVSCTNHCRQLLTGLPMSTESALFYLDLPCSTLETFGLTHLVQSAKKFLVDEYKEFFSIKYRHVVINIPLDGIEAILSSDDLEVASEDDIYDFVLKWARLHYPDLEERVDIWTSRLLPLVRFSYMTGSKLLEVLKCTDSDMECQLARQYAMKCFLCQDAPSVYAAQFQGFARRAYRFKPLTWVTLRLRPDPVFVVYMDLKRDECSKLFMSQSKYICSQPIYCAGMGFYISAHCNGSSESQFFGLLLEVQEQKGPMKVIIEYEFAARTNDCFDKMLKSEFVTLISDSFTFTGPETTIGCSDLFQTDLSELMGDDSHFFIEGMIQLSVLVTMKHLSI